MIESVTIDRHLVKIVRGDAELGDDFRLSDLYPPEAAALLGRHDLVDE